MTASYLYPISARIEKNNFNPYLEDFMTSLEKDFLFLNRNTPSDKGLLDVFKYIPKIKYIFFHWPENIPERKSGILQTILLFILLFVFRLKGIRVIYILHNKVSHSNRRLFLKKIISSHLIRRSFKIITHASEGVSFIRSLTNSRKDVFYFPHPVKKVPFTQVVEKTTDVLIWGIIAPYKGVDRFIRKLAQHEKAEKWKVVIAGKVAGEDYFKTLLKDKPGNVLIINEYISDDELNRLISGSKVVLFPYHKESVLSSGAFARTCVFPVSIVGPDCGSFRDFSDSPGVFVFKSEEEIIPLIDEVLKNPGIITTEHAEQTIGKYSWESFAKELTRELKEEFPRI